MTEKELRKLNKKDMIELLLRQSKIIKELKEENVILEEKLSKQEIKFKKSELEEIFSKLRFSICDSVKNTVCQEFEKNFQSRKRK